MRTAVPSPTPALLSRRDFVAGSAALVVASSLGLAGCSSGSPVASPPPSRAPWWVAVSTDGLRAGEPRWVEFDVPAGAASSPSVRPPATPSGTPADSLAGGRGAAWLVLQPDASVVAFAPKCTHRLCLYDWDGASREFRCRCHPGLFAIDGNVLGGPPPRPLDRLETRPAGPRVVEIGWVEQR